MSTQDYLKGIFHLPNIHFWTQFKRELGLCCLECKFMTNYKRNHFRLQTELFAYESARLLTTYFRLMMPSVDQSDSNKLVTQRPVAALTDAAWSDWLPYSLRYRCLLIWLWEAFLAMGKHFVRKLKSLRQRAQWKNSVFISQSCKTAISVQSSMLKVEYSL